ncbi:uncharacterized protein N7484_008933 [Penicillium longicatenatum]|uniref:uncharacterized protein n=1 Tax=Penicillium longicatenatum TaxID=1561947 RepID=UPI002549774E|nr:uncharacterized protein N7484_008933 [Penicillium longicatenatum]KAJ5635620.1 hypothetical protein N7484_008933 [Penicillium longicatenatum]
MADAIAPEPASDRRRLQLVPVCTQSRPPNGYYVGNMKRNETDPLERSCIGDQYGDQCEKETGSTIPCGLWGTKTKAGDAANDVSRHSNPHRNPCKMKTRSDCATAQMEGTAGQNPGLGDQDR